MKKSLAVFVSAVALVGHVCAPSNPGDYGNDPSANGIAAVIRSRMVTNCLPVSAHQFDAAVERAAL
jgi:hypothetical protein